MNWLLALCLSFRSRHFQLMASRRASYVKRYFYESTRGLKLGLQAVKVEEDLKQRIPQSNPITLDTNAVRVWMYSSLSRV